MGGQRMVYHLDRAAEMIPNEDQWKAIVDKNLKDHHDQEK